LPHALIELSYSGDSGESIGQSRGAVPQEGSYLSITAPVDLGVQEEQAKNTTSLNLSPLYRQHLPCPA